MGGGNVFTYIHNRLRNEIYRMARSAFPLADVRLEDRVGAYQYSPNYAPDITICNPFGDGKHILVDVTCIRPWVASQSHHSSSIGALTAAEDRKRLVYGDVSPHSFVPFAVDLYGGIGGAAVEFLRMCRLQQQQDRENSSLSLPWRIQWLEGWQQRLSITLARAISRVIRQRAGESFSQVVAANGHANMGPVPDIQGRVFDAPGEEAADVVAPVGVCVGHLGLPALGDCAD